MMNEYDKLIDLLESARISYKRVHEFINLGEIGSLLVFNIQVRYNDKDHYIISTHEDTVCTDRKSNHGPTGTLQYWDGNIMHGQFTGLSARQVMEIISDNNSMKTKVKYDGGLNEYFK